MCYRKIDSTKYSCGHDIPHGDQRIDCNSARCRYSSAHQDNCHDYKSTSSKQWLDINSATNPLDAFTINDGLCLPEHSGLDISWTRCSNNTCTSASDLHSLVWCPQCSSGTSYI
ncbi:hypothetical protein EDD85DRAFT_636079 [Armillaria nabsnona]|nr:hypothetical protein EDD85DRAFT_636079 [Armillaria nabsnona]